MIQPPGKTITAEEQEADEMQVQKAALLFILLGFSVIPIKEADKTPVLPSWKPYQTKAMSMETAQTVFHQNIRLAMICGTVSGNLECLDFDKPSLFQPFMDSLEEINKLLKKKLVKIQTPSGGSHLVYRCEQPIDGNQKLAMSSDSKDTWIETRGEGGYFITSPSPGYNLLENKLEASPILTIEEKEILHSLARSFSEKQEAPPLQKTTPLIERNRPGDEFNRKADESVWRELLEPEGWTFTDKVINGNRHLTRPGKDDGSTSATLKKGCLYVFSSNAGLPLEGHSAFSVYAHLKHGGNFSEAAKELHKQGRYHNKVSTLQNKEWPVPTPLPDALAPVAHFDFDLLPDSLRPWAVDICDRIQCAPDYVGVTILTALGTALSRKIGMRPQDKTDWTETANQWGLVIGRPGVLKSPAMEAALAPLKRLVAEATKLYKDATLEFQKAELLEKLTLDMAKKNASKALKDGDHAKAMEELNIVSPEKPFNKRYIVNDSSTAALGEIHRQNPNGLLVYRDEIVSLLRSLDQEENCEARGFYLTGWSGNSPYTIDRIGRGFDLHIPAVCLSMLGSTQPARLSGYIKQALYGGAGDDGLIQRFGLFVWPDSTSWKDVDRYPDNKAKQTAYEVFSHLDKLNPPDAGASQDTGINGEPEGLPFLRFDGNALGLFKEWRIDLEKKVRSEKLHPAFESHLAKYRKLVPSVALTIHLAGYGKGPVTEESLTKALAWAEYLETHANRAYGSVTMPDIATAKAIIQRIKKGDLKESFSSREVWRPKWSGLTDSKQVAEALQLLVEYDWIADETIPTPGRSKTIYTVNPHLVKS